MTPYPYSCSQPANSLHHFISILLLLFFSTSMRLHSIKNCYNFLFFGCYLFRISPCVSPTCTLSLERSVSWSMLQCRHQVKRTLMLPPVWSRLDRLQPKSSIHCQQPAIWSIITQVHVSPTACPSPTINQHPFFLLSFLSLSHQLPNRTAHLSAHSTSRRFRFDLSRPVSVRRSFKWWSYTNKSIYHSIIGNYWLQ